MRTTHAGIIVPAKIETQQIRNGRATLRSIMDAVLELHDKGKNPTKVIVSTALQDDMRAFFEYVAESFDGVLPKDLFGVPIEYVPGAARDIQIECDGDQRH